MMSGLNSPRTSTAALLEKYTRHSDLLSVAVKQRGKKHIDINAETINPQIC